MLCLIAVTALSSTWCCGSSCMSLREQCLQFPFCWGLFCMGLRDPLFCVGLRDPFFLCLQFTVGSTLRWHSVQVEGLTGCRVLHVACGVWHTAAVAAHVPGFDSLQQGSTEVDPAEWEAIQQKMANAYDVLDEVRHLRSSPSKPLTSRKGDDRSMPTSRGACMVTFPRCCTSGTVLSMVQCTARGLPHEESPGVINSTAWTLWKQLLCVTQEGGQLYTWGGAFEDSATKSMPLTPRLPAQQDNHQGCLGHGNKAGRLTPTRCAAAGC